MDLFAPWHLLLVLLIVLVVFGPRKLGDAGSAIGRAVRDFRKVIQEPEAAPKDVTPAPSKSSAEADAVKSA